MNRLRSFRILKHLTSNPLYSDPFNPISLSRFFSSQTELKDIDNNDSVFDSSEFAIPNLDSNAASVPEESTWDEKYRRRVDKVVFGKESPNSNAKLLLREQEQEERRRLLTKALLEAALEKPDDEDEDEVVREEDQKSLAVGIVGAPNAGKSALTNYMVGTKVSAVSRKTNTTNHEILGVMTDADTQICFFDTPGLMLKSNGYPYKDIKARVDNVWSAVDLYDILMVVFDVHRHLTRPDSRVVKLIERVGAQTDPKQKRILCMNKVDLVDKKKDLLRVAKQFKDLPGYDRCFMISALKGAGVKDLSKYLMEQAVKRPWDEDPLSMSEEVLKNISLEVVREKLLDHVHQEIPYSIEHKLVEWKELRDGSLRIEQHLITTKMSQRKILVGKKGSKIGRIGMEANEELRSIFKRDVHLILQVQKDRGFGANKRLVFKRAFDHLDRFLEDGQCKYQSGSHTMWNWHILAKIHALGK